MVSQTTDYLTGDAAFAVDRSGVIVLWNPAAENMLGYPASDALGQRCWELLSGQDTYGNPYCGEHCLLRDMAFQRKSVNGFKVVYKTGSNGRRQFTISCLSVFNEPGNELLLHLCHHEKETWEGNDDHITARLSANHRRVALTLRELEALAFLADGKTTREIAPMMSITVPTVRNHIQHLLKKLHVHSRLEAVMMGKRLDLI